jgi:hypothetical protein
MDNTVSAVVLLCVTRVIESSVWPNSMDTQLNVDCAKCTELYLLINFILKNKCIYKKGLGHAHPALCSSLTDQTSYSITAVAPQFLNICNFTIIKILYTYLLFILKI